MVGLSNMVGRMLPMMLGQKGSEMDLKYLIYTCPKCGEEWSMKFLIRMGAPWQHSTHNDIIVVECFA